MLPYHLYANIGVEHHRPSSKVPNKAAPSLSPSEHEPFSPFFLMDF